jgi:hypothetical protein
MTNALNTTYAQYNNQVALTEVELSNGVKMAAAFTYTVMATIPLRYLHDVFMKLPLTKGAQYKLFVNTHAPSSFTETVGVGAAVVVDLCLFSYMILQLFGTVRFRPLVRYFCLQYFYSLGTFLIPRDSPNPLLGSILHFVTEVLRRSCTL